MKIIYGLNNIEKPPRGSVATIGVFDGVHIGHKKIIDMAVSRARASGLKSIVLTFDPHPAKVLYPRPNVPSLISLDHRMRLIAERGVDISVVLKFTRHFSGLSPEKFLKDVLAGRLGVKYIYAGENFYFGKGAKAGTGKLKNMALSLGVKVIEVRPVMVMGRIASSSLARDLILKGDLAGASRILGRPVSVLGTVVSGSRIARALGYPTANVNPHHEAVPPAGVYAVTVRLGRKTYRGVLNIGVRPTFYGSRDEETAIEAHIFGFTGNIYGRDLEISFVKKIRDELKFSDRGELMRRIRQDVTAAKKLLYK
ncbi:MAG: bifunctional riboflavin kinase/FAD synthetase [Candidatus Omnitrophica bacterium]|nr:bifunctional riboflavin kinase/FAD synthetase [Candidatus Omnitrophota bacterium]